MRLLETAIYLSIFVFFFSRSALGNRNKSKTWPKWAERWGDRDIPKIIGSGWFFWFAWISRRLLPVLLSITIVSLWDNLFENNNPYLLSGPDWLAILGLSFGCFVAYCPFAKKPRRHPLDKWMGMIFGMQFVGCGILLTAAAVFIHYVHQAPEHYLAKWHFVKWITVSPLASALGISGAMIGFGVAIMGLVEVLPNWRTGANIIDNSAELKDLKLRNAELESENKKLRVKLRSYNQRRRH